MGSRGGGRHSTANLVIMPTPEGAKGPGEYELNLYPVSEIIPNKALKNLGPVTAELQVPVIISAVIGKHANDERAARALVEFLQGPALDRPLEADGMMKGKPAG